MFTISGDSEIQSGWFPVLFVETYNNGPHDITLLEVSFGAGGMSIMAGDAGIRDREVYCQALELVPIFKSEHAGGWIGHQFFQSVFLCFGPR